MNIIKNLISGLALAFGASAGICILLAVNAPDPNKVQVQRFGDIPISSEEFNLLVNGIDRQLENISEDYSKEEILKNIRLIQKRIKIARIDTRVEGSDK